MKRIRNIGVMIALFLALAWWAYGVLQMTGLVD